MKVELFALCNYVSNHNGKLAIIETFDTLVADKFPFRAYFGIAVKIDISNEVYDNNLNINFYICKKGDKKDHHLFNAEASIKPPISGKLVFVGNVKGLIFDFPGEYLFVVSSNNNKLIDYTFSVREKILQNKQGNGQ